ncbi:MAG TPA: glycoside hydrolase family 3 C-terminal domain-containing protein [Rhizomicrobium sp.]
MNDLVSRMTLEEKASQLVNQARAIPRLGVPAYNWWNEALHGVARNGIATVFPQAIGLGATFNPPLIHEMGVAISTEARVKYNQAGYSNNHGIFAGLTFWSPNINIFRDPRWGRGQETYGEDPFLSGLMGKAFVTGMQGDDPKYLRTITTPKHYAVHSGPEPTRHEVDVPASKHDMRDTYLPQFRTAIVDGKAGSVMCAYNRVNGQPACAHDFLLMETLRKAWDFKGVVVSDCDAIADIERGHHFTKTYAEAAAVSLKTGVDNDCADFAIETTDSSDYQRYIDAVKEGHVPESVVDESLRRLFTARMKLGMFDPKEMVKHAQVPDSELDSEAHGLLALKAARESMVLLKNNGSLPLKQSVKRIAVIGPLADQVTPLLGNYNGTPSHPVTALEGLKRQFPNAEITFEPGTNFLRAVEAVPPPVLTTDNGQPGLKAEFFGNEEFSGAAVMTRVDANVDYTRDVGLMRNVPLPKVTPFAVRWTGTLTPTETGDYMVGLDTSTGRLSFDGKNLVNIGGPGERTAKTALVHLEAGHKYAVKIERGFAHNLAIKLVWSRQIPDAAALAVAAAQKADVVVAVVGITSQLEGEEMVVEVPGFKGGDRVSIDLPKDEEDLLKAVRAATKKPLGVVLYNGSALSVNWAAKNADAIVDAWYGGQAAGTAIAEVLSGAYNPAGRLPVTFYTGVEQLPPFEDYSMANRTYRYFKGKPLYSFGYGLSYAKFAYSGLQLSTPAVKAGDMLGVDVDVKNVSDRDGDEVAQLYLAFPKVPGTPIRALRGVQRVHLKAGETQRLHFDLGPRDLSSVTEAGDIVVQPGDYALSVGGGPRGATKAIVATGFKIDGEQKLAE